MLIQSLLLTVLLWKGCTSQLSLSIVVNNSAPYSGSSPTLSLAHVGDNVILWCYSSDGSLTYWYEDQTQLKRTTHDSAVYGVVTQYIYSATAAGTVVFTCRSHTILSPVAVKIQVTSSTTHRPTSTSTPSPTPSTSSRGSGSSHSPSHSPSNSNGNGNSNSKNNFKGVNPLIYTVIAVFLLGTLAVVAIVTCWIRARRSFYRRNQLPQYTTPRDYFDGISDSDFTPITASQFYASLRDAPPTYHESEVIQASIREERDTNNSSPSEQPPPLPPRNIPRQQTPNGSGQETSTRLSPARRQDDEDDEDFLLLPTSSLLDSAIPPMDAQM